MNSLFRKILTLPVCGLSWFAGLKIFFIYSRAQQILASPEHQSQKFLNAFFIEPLPRMFEDSWLPLKGFMVCGLMMGAVFIFLNNKLQLNWLNKGLQFGLISWALIIPWFEFYLPYNVMREPLALVLLEAALWFPVMLMNGLAASFILNFKLKK